MIGGRSIVFAIVALLGACEQQRRVGDFTYRCTNGWGMFDGPQCVARLNQRFELRLWEDGSGPALQYVIGHGAADVLPTYSEDATRGRDIIGLGMTNDVIVVEDGAGQWWIVSLTENEAGQNWPKVDGPIPGTDVEFVMAPVSVPEMRSTR